MFGVFCLFLCSPRPRLSDTVPEKTSPTLKWQQIWCQMEKVPDIDRWMWSSQNCKNLRVSQKYTYFAQNLYIFLPTGLGRLYGWGCLMLKRQKKYPGQHMWADSVACWPEWETCLHKFLQLQSQMQKIRWLRIILILINLPTFANHPERNPAYQFPRKGSRFRFCGDLFLEINVMNLVWDRNNSVFYFLTLKSAKNLLNWEMSSMAQHKKAYLRWLPSKHFSKLETLKLDC